MQWKEWKAVPLNDNNVDEQCIAWKKVQWKGVPYMSRIVRRRSALYDKRIVMKSNASYDDIDEK